MDGPITKKIDNEYLHVGFKDHQGREISFDKRFTNDRIIDNYDDLTFLNYTNVVLFYESKEDFEKRRNAYFLHGLNETLSLSKKSYGSLFFFYKNYAFCIVNESAAIIDINENIIFSQKDPRLNDDSVPNINDSLSSEELIFELMRLVHDYYCIEEQFNSQDQAFKDIFYEMCRCMDMYDLDLEDPMEDIGHKRINNSLGKEHFFAIMPIEESLGMVYSTAIEIESDKYKWIGNFDEFTGNWMVEKENNSFAFINKFYYQVGEDFHEYFGVNQESVGFLTNEERKIVDFIGRNGRVYMIKYTGSFIEECIRYPQLFIDNDKTLELVKNDRKIELADVPEKYKTRSYYKFDKDIIDKAYQREIHKDGQFRATENWENLIIENEICTTNGFDVPQKYNYFLPFSDPENNPKSLKDRIKEHRKLFGKTYSSYRILAEVGEYDKESEKLSIASDIVRKVLGIKD